METEMGSELKRKGIIERFMNRQKVQTFLTKLKSGTSLFNLKIEGMANEVKEDIQDLFDLYGISPCFLNKKLKINHTSWWMDCTPLEQSDLDIYLPIFFKEFSLYPVSLIKKSKLKKIYFVNSLMFSTSSYSQYRAAVPDYCSDQMAMIYCCKERSLDYITNVIHHEFFHFIDYIEDGKLYGPDPEWESLNTSGFTYGNGGANNREWKPLQDDASGFLNFYSTTGVEEDKAEIFAHMMKFPNQISSTKCQILTNKFNNLLNLMKKFDSEGLGRDAYWEELVEFRLSEI